MTLSDLDKLISVNVDKIRKQDKPELDVMLCFASNAVSSLSIKNYTFRLNENY